MLKNTYFLEKVVKNRLSVGGSAPESPWPPAAGASAPRPPPTITTLSSSFLALSLVYYLQKKKNKFCIFQFFAAIFHFKLCSFCWQEAQKYFMPQGAGYLFPSYCRINVTKQSMKYKGPFVWNKIPFNTKQTKNYNKFREGMKNYLLQSTVKR